MEQCLDCHMPNQESKLVRIETATAKYPGGGGNVEPLKAAESGMILPESDERIRKRAYLTHPMQRQSKVDFREVKAIFFRDNLDTPERNEWPLGALEIANNQFRDWTKVLLFPEDLGNIMLPWHDHSESLVPPSGSLVSEALEKLEGIDHLSDCYRRIKQFTDPRTTAIFLSVPPINDPRYPDYKGLVDRGYKGLTHLDGLHRLIAWGSKTNERFPPTLQDYDWRAVLC